MSYDPTFPGEFVTPQWLYDELRRVAEEMPRVTVNQYEVLSMEPARPQPGMVACADGIGWNPLGSATASSTGSVAGLYQYINGAWRKL